MCHRGVLLGNGMIVSLLMIALGGAIGAVARFGTVVLTAFWLGNRLPYGTLLVNGLGSFLAGFLMVIIMERLAFAELWRLFLVVGFLGAYTTFSSFSWETWVLFERGDLWAACLNVLANNVFSLGLALLGINVGRLVGA